MKYCRTFAFMLAGGGALCVDLRSAKCSGCTLMNMQNQTFIGFLAFLVLLMVSFIAGEACAAPPPKDVNATISNAVDNPVPVDVRVFSANTPVPIVNPPIPFEFTEFPRQYCAPWKRKGVIQETETRRLVEYEAILPTVNFDQELFWAGDIYGSLFATEAVVSIGHSGTAPVVTACVGEVRAITYEGNFIPRLLTGNQYEIGTEVSGFACFFDEIYPVDISVQARILEHKDLPLPASTATGEEGDGSVCFNLQSVETRGAE